MTVMTPTAKPTAAQPETPSVAASAGFKTRTAGVLAALARRIDRAAERRARRQAARMTAAELARLPEAVRMELGVNLPEPERRRAAAPSPFLQGLAGPAITWGPQSGGPRRSDAKS
jgi:hypothetical protein